LTLSDDQVADRGDVVGEIEMHAGDGVAHLFGLADQGLALVGEIAQQIADAHFVVVIGALERGHFVVHQRFQLGRAGERAFDAVAHGGDLAADGLADADDRIARRGLGFGETHGDGRHGFGDPAHVLRAAEHVGEHVVEDHRHHDRADDADERGVTDARGGEQRLQFVGVEIGGGQPAGGPDDGGDAGDDIRHARRTAAQRLQDLSDIGAVVVGGAARRRLVGPVLRARRLAEQVGGGGRSARGRCQRRVRARGSPWRLPTPPGWRRAPLPSRLWIFADCWPFRSSPRSLRWTIAAARDVRRRPRHARGTRRNGARARTASLLTLGLHPIALAIRKKPRQ
jgi:hypothetical protein